MKYIRVTCMACVTILLTFAFGCTLANASDVGFSVRASLPENQRTHDVSYFYLNTNPGGEQTLQVAIHNRSDEDMVVALQANTAYTNANGVIDYTRLPLSLVRGGESNMDFESMVTIVEPRVFVSARNSTMAEFQLRMPPEPFEGELLGGLVFTKLSAESFAAWQREQEGLSIPYQEAVEQPFDSASGGMEIRHVFNYCIALRLAQGDIGKIAPDFTLEGAGLEDRAGFPSLTVNLRNQSNLVIEGAELDVHVYDQDETMALSMVSQRIAMTPQSAMPYALYLPDKAFLPPGVYRVTVTLRFHEEEWEFETLMRVD